MNRTLNIYEMSESKKSKSKKSKPKSESDDDDISVHNEVFDAEHDDTIVKTKSKQQIDDIVNIDNVDNDDTKTDIGADTDADADTDTDIGQEEVASDTAEEDNDEDEDENVYDDTVIETDVEIEDTIEVSDRNLVKTIHKSSGQGVVFKNIVTGDNRVASEKMTMAIFTSVISLRAKHISQGGPIFIDKSKYKYTTARDWALEEMRQLKCPLMIRLKIGNIYEEWRINEMIPPDDVFSSL